MKGAAIGAGLGSVIGAPKIAFNFKYLTDYKSLLKKIIEGEIKRQEENDAFIKDCGEGIVSFTKKEADEISKRINKILELDGILKTTGETAIKGLKKTINACKKNIKTGAVIVLAGAVIGGAVKLISSKIKNNKVNKNN